MTFLNSTFAHPGWLLALVLPFVAAAAYWISTKQRGQRTIASGNFIVVGPLGNKSSARLRHVVAISALLPPVLAIISLAGPISEAKVAYSRATVMLVVDASLSMSATDVAPDRITVTKGAGQEFAENLPGDLNIGLVTFSGRARTAVSPTINHDIVNRALQAAELDQVTATGDAIAAAFDATNQFNDSVQGGGEGTPPATIALLSDGKQTVPQEFDDSRGVYTVAAEATKAGVSVNTISFGTAQSAITVQGELISVPNDDDSLREIVRRTKGEFFSAGSLKQLRDAYGSLEDDIGYELKRAENPRPYLIAAFAMLLVTVGSLLMANCRIPQWGGVRVPSQSDGHGTQWVGDAGASSSRFMVSSDCATSMIGYVF